MANTWSGKAFVSHDGPDETGLRAEVKVTKGFGVVTDLKQSGKGKAANAVFTVENTEYASSGWTPVDGEIYKLCEKSLKTGEPIHFRIEVFRQKHVDRSIPINEISDLAHAKDNIFKGLAAVREDDGDWIMAPTAKTRMDEDPRDGDGTSANDYTREELDRLAGKTTGATSVAAAAPETYGFEASPREALNADGGPNMGYQGMDAPLESYLSVLDYCASKALDLSDKEKFAWSRNLLKAATKLQLEVYGDRIDGPELSAPSHKRARQLVIYMTRYFYPLEEYQENPAEWADLVVTKASKMWQWAAGEVA